MFQHSIAFDRPAYLVLLALIPLMIWLGRHSLAGLGRVRRWTALGLRSLVTLLIVMALADAQYRRQSDELSVVYLLDQSLSIPAPQRQAMLEYVNASLAQHRQPTHNDRFGVIVFGRDAVVEAPLASTAVSAPPRLESVLDPEYSDLATAVQRAKALMPASAARRIVLVTDGNENVGNVYREARAAADGGVSIDVVPVRLAPRGDVAVEKLDVPAGVRRGQPFDMRVVLRNDSPDPDAKPIDGRLLIVRKAGAREEIVADQQQSIPPGKHVLSMPENIDEADFYTYEAKFIADDAADDAVPQNNQSSGFVHVRGKGNVLLIENADARGQFDHLVDRLRAKDIEVTVVGTDNLFNSLAELQRYDAVVLANVARSAIQDADSAASFSDDQIEMLVRNTRELGCGLVMIGGPDSFGAGGWANTKLEQAMPVDFQIKAAEVVPVGALSIVIDRSGSMDGEKLAMSKRAAIEAIRAMGARDYISVVAFDSLAQSIVPIRRVGEYRTAARRVDAIGSGGGTDMYPGMVQGFADLRKAEASVKHMIVLTDGQTPDAAFTKLVSDMRKANITVSTVAVGDDANVPLLSSIATGGKGKFYAVTNARALPRIFLREVRRVARPLVFEPSAPVTPVVVDGDHEILRGVEAGVPPITGLVLTSVKQNPLVEVLLRSPQPATPDNATLLATWTYGAGKAAVFTTDAGRRWATAWTEWDGYDKFFSQLIRWAMRPSGDAGNLTVATDVREGKTELVVTALDADDEFLNNQAITAFAVAPDMTTLPIRVQQTAPGRYVGEFPSEKSGSYLIVVNPGGGKAPIRTGVSVGYSAEYRARETNVPLLESLAALPAAGGPPGVFVSEGLEAAIADGDSEQNPFRRDLKPATADRSIWPWLVVAASCLFWGDVFVRRVQVDLSWLSPALARTRDFVLRRQAAPAMPETMSRLRSRKRQLGNEIAQRRSAVRFESSEAPPAGAAPPVVAAATPELAAPAVRPPTNEPDSAPAESYTERLLKAKKQAMRDRNDPRGGR
jgi:uncharacterized membrane protein